MKKYALIIEEFACWGCKTCEVACKQEHNPAHGMSYNHVWEDGPKLADGKMEFTYRVNVCRHCDEPPCQEVCPVEAIKKRDDGIVILNSDDCSGCGLCLDACPYGAIRFDEKENAAAKCNLCHHRVDNHLYPACADNVCLAHCIYFGYPDEIETIIEKKKKKRASI